MRALLVVLVLVLVVLLAGCAKGPEHPGVGPAGGGEGYSEVRYYLNATLAPPLTTFNIVQSHMGLNLTRQYSPSTPGDTYAWSNSNGCGRFAPGNATAQWDHGEDTNCSHDGPLHGGTIRVTVGGLDDTVSSTGYMLCEYNGGSASGRSEACQVSSVAPAGAAPARPIAIPAPGLGIVALTLLGAALLARPRRG